MSPARGMSGADDASRADDASEPAAGAGADGRPGPHRYGPAGGPERDGGGTVLVTGFEPFGGLSENPSRTAALAAAEALPRVRARILPVEYRAAPQALVEAIREVRPETVVCLGVAVGREQLCVERVALNCADARIPDNTGAQPRDEWIDPDAPAALFTSLPIRRILRTWQEAGLPARISETAGTYVCNRVMFEALARAERLGVSRAGFLHVPDTRQMPQDRIDHGVRLAVGSLLGD